MCGHVGDWRYSSTHSYLGIGRRLVASVTPYRQWKECTNERKGKVRDSLWKKVATGRGLNWLTGRHICLASLTFSNIVKHQRYCLGCQVNNERLNVWKRFVLQEKGNFILSAKTLKIDCSMKASSIFMNATLCPLVTYSEGHLFNTRTGYPDSFKMFLCSDS